MKSTVRRAFAVLLAIVFVFAGFEWSGIAKAIADAGSVDTLGTTDVGETPEDLSTMGEWVYWIEDGTARIAGYNGLSETNLKIPEKLEGYPVVAIGQQAFSKNEALTRIQIHTNVTFIAEDAFEGLTGVTVVAYHGAYALDYAAQHGMPAYTVSVPGVEYATGVIDMDGAISGSYSEVTQNGAVFKAKEATYLKVGQILDFQKSAAFPTGLAVKVETIELSGEKAIVTFSQPEWGECFELVEGQDELIVDWEHAELAEDVELMGVEASAWASTQLSVNVKLKNKKSVEGKLKIDFNKPTISYKVGWRWWGIIKIPDVQEFQLDMPATATFSLKYGAKDKLDPGKGEGRIVDRKTICTLPAASIGGVFNGYITVDFVFELSGSIVLSTTVNCTMHLQKKNGKTNKWIEKQISEFSLEANASLKMGPEFKIYFVLGWHSFSIRIIEFSLGFFFKVDGKASLKTIRKGTISLMCCLDAKIAATIEVSAKIGIVKLAKWDVKAYLELSKTWEVWKKNWHFDNFSKVDKCTLKDREVVIKADGKWLASTKGDVGRLISKVNPPSKKGYKFDGWYVNTKASGLPGNDYKFDFNVDGIAYCGKNGTFTIEGRYSKITVDKVKLNKNNQTVYLGESGDIQLKATVTPSNAYNTKVSWKSSNTDVATVTNNGLVHPKGVGTATITCTSSDNSKKKDTFTLTVKQHVTGITVSANNAGMMVGDTKQMTATVAPSNASDKSVNWSSTNSSVATVNSSGLVTAVGEGTATIKATAKDGSNVSGSYTITVYPAPQPVAVPVTGISLNQTTLTINTTNTSGVQLNATVTPSNATNTSVTWKSSNTSVATVSSSGRVTPVSGGTAVIECRSVSNPNVYATCTVTVVRLVSSITISGADKIEIGDQTQLVATVLPSDASNKGVTWTSSNPSVATVDSTGLVTGVAAGYTNITAKAKDGSNVTSAAFRVEVGEVPPVTVESITLDQTQIEMYTNEPSPVQLKATVAPADADDPSVTWTSSNTDVATVDANGYVTPVAAGTATITCSSNSNPSVTATCAVTVKQYVEQIVVDSSKTNFFLGETANATASVYPTDATVQAITWSSSDTAVATVDQTGKITAVGIGTADIITTANDGSQVSGSCSVEVKNVLQLDVTMLNDTVFTQGDSDCTIAYVALTNESAQRMAAEGRELVWSMTRVSGSGDTQMTVIPLSTEGANGAYNTSFVSLSGKEYPTAGTEVYRVTCVAGPYQESVDVTVTVDGTEYASEVKLKDTSLSYNTLTASENEQVEIVNPPYSADGKPVPQGMTVDLTGDIYYLAHGVENESNTDKVVTIDESGIYTANVLYRKANLAYTVAATFRIADQNGVVHLRVEEISLDKNIIEMVEGENATVTATVLPDDAYNKSVTWTSSDPSVATVTAAGAVHAVAPGLAVLTCSASDGSGVIQLCTVSVESYLQLDEKELDLTVYVGGEDHADLDIVNVTIDSQRRLEADGENVTWKLTRLSGNNTELGLSEYRSARNGDISVSGNIIKLLRINGAGTDEYLLTCTAGEYSDSCTIHVHAVDVTLPTSIALTTNAFSGTVDEWIEADLSYTAQPNNATLPENTRVTIEGGNAFWNALSGLYSYAEPEKLIFERAGVFTANVVFEGVNYRYECPITITVADEEGVVPTAITKVELNEDVLLLSPGETSSLSLVIEPVNAAYSQATWTSTDTSVATVSSEGVVTAIGAGWATIVASVPESDQEGTCLVYVEEGINFRDNELEQTVFVDGTTRMILDTMYLTDNTCTHMDNEPEWTLRRVSGNSLTLRAVPCETVNANGDTIYGCGVMLYSVSKEGDTVYELVCSNGSETATATLTIHSVLRERILPASISLSETVFTADINELIVVSPEIITQPADCTLPAGMVLTCVGGKQYQQALNADDTYVSQSISTFSFHKAGTYEANFEYSYSNMKYIVPVVFRIKDSNGVVPVQGSKVSLNSRNLYMLRNDTAQLEAVFTPVNATNQAVTWTSSDPSVATVDANGLVTAVANGMCTIYCMPDDTECTTVTCAVTVEDYLTVNAGTTTRTLYVQGTQNVDIAHPMLSEGTIERLKAEGVEPTWTINKNGLTCASVEDMASEDGTAYSVITKQLLAGGSNTFTISCTAGDHQWSQTYTLQVVDLGATAPQTVTIASPEVHVAVNESVTVDFTPVVLPQNASMPSGMNASGFVGIGDFYKALDYSVYRVNGNNVTVAFKEAGQYLLTKRYVLGNLQYVTACTFIVGNANNGRNLLSATETEFTVYNGGKSGIVSSVSVTDSTAEQLWGDTMAWSIERVSGNSLTAALKQNGDGVDVFIASVENNGTDVWRVICSFGGMTESVDITLTAADPRGDIPESIALAANEVTGMIGNWLYLPLGVTCSPSGTMLPDQGDAFWSFSFDQAGEERSVHKIEDNILKVCFTMGGYYTGTLTYRSGNVSYTLPVYFVIEDEEGVVREPNLHLYLVNAFDTVYPEGETGVAIGQVVIAETLSTYNTGASVAYMKDVDANWTISQNGSSATLSLRKVSPNVYDVVLNSVGTSGNIAYTVNCVFGGKQYTVNSTLHVAGNSEARPDATLSHTVYKTVVGETVEIDRQMYSREDGSVLQSSTHLDPTDLLRAVGYEIKEKSDAWTMTFYHEGTYEASVCSYVSNLKIELPVTIQVSSPSAGIVLTVLKLPASLTEVAEEAFEGVSADVIDMRGTQIRVIHSSAFRNCINVSRVYLPAGVNEIADNAFYGCLNAVFYCEQGSYAANWAVNHGFTVAEQ